MRPDTHPHPRPHPRPHAGVGTIRMRVMAGMSAVAWQKAMTGDKMRGIVVAVMDSVMPAVA